MSTIRQIEPWIDDAEAVQLRRVIETTYVTEGPLTEEFEARIRALTGSPYAIAYANGTLAEFALLKACGVEPGDEVIVPDMTFIATANAALLANAKPVFADVSLDTLGLTVASIAPLVTSRTKAIVPVHLYGGMADIEEIVAFAKKRNIVVIEDAAQAVGVKDSGRHAGTWGAGGFLSFYGNKTMTTGEGAIIMTHDETIARACYRLKNHGRDRKGEFVHDHIGYNFCFTDLQAAVGLAQLNKLPEIIRRKRANFEIYRGTLGKLNNLRLLTWRQGLEPVPWFTNIRVDHAGHLAKYLAECGIESRRFFYPLHRQPCYVKNKIGYIENEQSGSHSFPNSQTLYETGLSLPSSVTLEPQDIQTVCKSIAAYLTERHKEYPNAEA